MDRDKYITDAQVVKRANAAVKLAIEKKKITETPIVVYDRATQNICHLNSDGSLYVVGKRRTVGRYSERIKNK